MLKLIGIIIISFIGLTLFGWLLWGLGIATGVITLPTHNLENKIQMNHEIIDQTVNAKNCTTWQDWFKTSEGNITTLQQTTNNAWEALDRFNKQFPDSSKWTDIEQQQYTVLSDNLTGAKNEANDAINTYDAKAKQENLAYCKNGLPIYFHPF